MGLTPDVVVKLPDPLPAGADPTLDKALELLDAAAFAPSLRAAWPDEPGIRGPRSCAPLRASGTVPRNERR